ncbi:hypothetical protein [Brachybacterium subflavum]|uniref:hypothetical protein n=1 Tax=Brachybacterium subflavum TaxID=2585206 RepID=UPI001D0D0542|nr:hypothetical protein [Brachybacterium subflavum]
MAAGSAESGVLGATEAVASAATTTATASIGSVEAAAIDVAVLERAVLERAVLERGAAALETVMLGVGVVLRVSVMLGMLRALRTLRALRALGTLRVSGVVRVSARTTARTGSAAPLARAEAQVIGVHGPSFLGASALASASHECPAQGARVEFLMLVVMIVMASHE